PTVAFMVCNSAPAPALTSTKLEVAPISSLISRVSTSPTCTFWSDNLARVNPVLETVRVYTPGGTLRKRYRPTSLVSVDRSALVEVSVRTAIAPTTTASCVSVTWPDTVSEEVDCAKAGGTPRGTSEIETIAVSESRN